MQDHSKPLILIVDDDREVRFGTRIRLEAAGYRTREATDGEECLEMTADYQPDVILLDIRMPKMDGLAALYNLKSTAATSRIPVIMLSASVVDKKEAIDNGATYFLAKPYHGKDLLAAVEAASKSGHSPASTLPASVQPGRRKATTASQL
jgi:DNA-binding response OmpR family regulator